MAGAPQNGSGQGVARQCHSRLGFKWREKASLLSPLLRKGLPAAWQGEPDVVKVAIVRWEGTSPQVGDLVRAQKAVPLGILLLAESLSKCVHPAEPPCPRPQDESVVLEASTVSTCGQQVQCSDTGEEPEPWAGGRARVPPSLGRGLCPHPYPSPQPRLLRGQSTCSPENHPLPLRVGLRVGFEQGRGSGERVRV